MTRPRGVVVVAYGTPDLLAATLAAVAGERVVVVDNSGRSDVRAVARAAGAHYVDPQANLGFAAGVNRGIAALRELGTSGDVLLLNPDARIDPTGIDALQAVLAGVGNGDVAAVAPALVDPAGRPQQVLWPFPSPTRMWLEALGLARLVRGPRFAVGAVLLLRAAALDDVGPFDERYFLYAEEADWQQRAVRRGWRTVVAPAVVAVHVGGGTATGARAQQDRFHAGQETYVRRWSGPLGWQVYRAGVVVGALARAVVLTGARRRDALDRARRYRTGPVTAAALAPREPALHITHVVVTEGSAGVEHYVAEVAARQHARGHAVSVIGGDGDFLRSVLPSGVTWTPGGSVVRAARALRRGGSRDVVHAHLTAADLVAVVTRPWHGARVVSTRHIAGRRGSSRTARCVAVVLQRGIDLEVFISAFVADRAGRPGQVLPNGVATDHRVPAAGSRTILVAQRLEAEKATDVAVRAFARSGLAARGWTLTVCGAGAQLAALQELTRDLGAAGVTWRGWVPDVRAELLGAAALLATAPAEPFGLTVVEAMSLGLPVIAAAGGGHLETVGRCDDALLFGPGDIDDCARALLAFAAVSAPDRQRYGAGLRALQRREFDLDAHVIALERRYRRPAGPGPRAGFAVRVSGSASTP